MKFIPIAGRLHAFVLVQNRMLTQESPLLVRVNPRTIVYMVCCAISVSGRDLVSKILHALVPYVYRARRVLMRESHGLRGYYSSGLLSFC